MGWLSTLYETYMNMSQSQSEMFEDLLPIAHTTQQAHIEVTINEIGDYVEGRVVDKMDSETVIPCTEQSAGRSGSQPIHHPLMDKFQYVAGDYTKYGGVKGDSFHKKYMEDLKEWVESNYSSPKLKALYNYLERGTLISDLIQDKVLHIDEDNKLLEAYPDKANTPPIFKVIAGKQSDAFVRFRVIGVEGDHSDDKAALWNNKKLRQDYINYYLKRRQEEELCYVLGERTSCSVNHPSKLRNPGDMAKLISANDTSGYTFRGRFIKAEEAAGISYEVSQGAHNALKWLIKHQGKNYGGRVYITWNHKVYDMPKIDDDSLDAILGCNEKIPNTAKEFSKAFHKAMSGYIARLGYDEKVIVMGIDAATTGRMAVTFYREELADEFINNLEHWHTTCSWNHRFVEGNSPKEFFGAPSPTDIALTAFGIERSNKLEMDDKLKKNIVERILHCIIDREALPFDLVNGAYQKVCHPQNYSNRNIWLKVLSIYCSLHKKYDYDHRKNNKKEEWTVELNEKEESLAYLCGRLLAVADALEWSTYSEEEKRRGRMTNAMNYFTKFVEHPCQTWGHINNNLLHYMVKLGDKAIYYKRLISEITARIPENEFFMARNLDGRMALGFYSQQHSIYSKKDDHINYENDSDNNVSENEEE